MEQIILDLYVFSITILKCYNWSLTRQWLHEKKVLWLVGSPVLSIILSNVPLVSVELKWNFLKRKAGFKPSLLFPRGNSMLYYTCRGGSTVYPREPQMGFLGRVWQSPVSDIITGTSAEFRGGLTSVHYRGACPASSVCSVTLTGGGAEVSDLGRCLFPGHH